MKYYSDSELVTMLQEACQAQFGFNPALIKEDFFQVGQGLRGQSHLHYFREPNSHAEIVLDVSNRSAYLVREYWGEREMEHYRKTRGELQTAEELRANRIEAALGSAWFQIHREYLGSLTPHPDGPCVFEEAKRLLEPGLVGDDPDALALAEAVGTRDLDILKVVAIEASRRDRYLQSCVKIRAHAKYPELLQLFLGLEARPQDREQFRQLACDICCDVTGKPRIFAEGHVVVVHDCLEADALQQAPSASTKGE